MILCVVGLLDSAARALIASKLVSSDVELRFQPSLQELIEVLKGDAISGMLLEVKTVVKATPTERKTIQELTELYPSAKFRIHDDKILIPGKSLEEFEVDCRSCKPRSIRKSIRRSEYLAMHLHSNDSYVEAEKVFTLNISEGGCFAFSAREWVIGDQALFRFEGDTGIRKGTIRSWIPWGNNEKIPGIGIQFGL